MFLLLVIVIFAIFAIKLNFDKNSIKTSTTKIENKIEYRPTQMQDVAMHIRGNAANPGALAALAVDAGRRVVGSIVGRRVGSRRLCHDGAQGRSESPASTDRRRQRQDPHRLSSGQPAADEQRRAVVPAQGARVLSSRGSDG